MKELTYQEVHHRSSNTATLRSYLYFRFGVISFPQESNQNEVLVFDDIIQSKSKPTTALYINIFPFKRKKMPSFLQEIHNFRTGIHAGGLNSFRCIIPGSWLHDE